MREAIGRVRRFNRFYTGQIGVVSEHLLKSDYSLAEARVLYEIAHRERPKASDIAQGLRLDRGYLSRILRRFHRDGLLERIRSREDARSALLSLTAKGRRTMATLEARSDDEVSGLLQRERRDLGGVGIGGEGGDEVAAPERIQDGRRKPRGAQPGDEGLCLVDVGLACELG